MAPKGDGLDQHNSQVGNMYPLRRLRAALYAQEMYVSQLEARKVIRDRLRARLNEALGHADASASTDVPVTDQHPLRDLQQMLQIGRCISNGADTSVAEGSIMADGNEHPSEEGKDFRSWVVFSQAIQSQLLWLSDAELWSNEGDMRSSAVTLINRARGSHSTQSPSSTLEKKQNQKKIKQRVAKVGSDSWKCMETPRSVKQEDLKFREEILKGLERVIRENSSTFTLTKGIGSEEPLWLKALTEDGGTCSENVSARELPSEEDYSDDFEIELEHTLNE